jgi:hypothetical protein
MVCTYKQDELLYLNDDGDQHQQLLEAEHTKHIYLCAKESPEADKQEWWRQGTGTYSFCEAKVLS